MERLSFHPSGTSRLCLLRQQLRDVVGSGVSGHDDAICRKDLIQNDTREVY